MSTHWAVIVADAAAAAGVIVAFGAARFAQLSNRKSIKVTSTMAAVEVFVALAAAVADLRQA